MNNYARVGFQNEESIVNYLNQKHFKNLDDKWKEHLKEIFPFITDSDRILCYKFPNHHSKPDIAIKVRHTVQYISIKSGKNPSIHQEDYFVFSKFLKKLGVSNRTLSTIYFYHFGESKKLKNKTPLTKDQIMEKYGKYVDQANKELDQVDIIEAVIERAVFKGASGARTAANYLYYGSLSQGVLLSKERIYEAILSYREHKDRPIHFGALNYQPQSRQRKTIDYRYVRIKWPLLAVMFYKEGTTNKSEEANKEL